MAELLYKEESYAIVGAAMHVHDVLGCGFGEELYHEALAIEFAKRGIPFVHEKRFQVEYEGHVLRHDFYVDFLCYGTIAVEVKAVAQVLNVHKAQLISYLAASGLKLGYLINFGETELNRMRLFPPYRRMKQFLNSPSPDNKL